MEVAIDLALQCSPDHPWVTKPPGVVHHQARRHDRLRREPAEEVPGHLPDQLRQRPRGLYAEVPARRPALDRRHGVRIFRVDNPHTKPVKFWQWLIGRSARSCDPDVLFLAEAFTRPPMMHELAKVGFHQSYTYFTWRTLRRRSSRTTSTSSHRVERWTTCGRTSSSTRPTSCTRALQTGGPADLQDPRRARRDRERRRGACTRASSCTSTCRPPGQRGVPRLREVPAASTRFRRSATAADGRLNWRRSSPRAQRDPPAAHARRVLQQLRDRAVHLPRVVDNPDITCSASAMHLDRTDTGIVETCTPEPVHEWRGGHTCAPRPRGAGSSRSVVDTPKDPVAGPRPRPALRRGVLVGRVQLPAPRPRHPVRARPARQTPDDPLTDLKGQITSSPKANTLPRRRRHRRRTRSPPPSSRTRSGSSRAVFYEVLVRGFADSNGDGSGDLRGLTDRLDYLQWLGVDCLWLPPFYQSPLRDGGYDVSDYTAVLPEFGTVEDFEDFLDAVHDRGMRVIVDFVMNHTSDQHPWFQASRSTTPTGPTATSTSGTTTTRRYPDARIIFVDTEPSNWTFDPVRRQYFWHRFFSHQPDLNFESPDVQSGDHRRAALLAGHGHRRLPARRGALPLRPRRHERREPARDARVPQAGAQGDRPRLPRPRPAVRGEPVAGRRRRVLRRPVRGRRRVPHGLPLPRHAAHLHGRAPRVALPHLRDHEPDPGDSRDVPVGHLPAQPRRADPRDGYRRRTRLHVVGVRARPADEGQHRHPPPPRPAARERHQPDRAVHRAAALAARLARPVLRRRDRDGRQHLARRPRRRPHPDAVDTRPQRRASRPPSRSGSTCRPTRTRSTATRSPTSRRRPATRPRCCTGRAG